MKTLKALVVTIVLAVLIFPLTVLSTTYFELPGIKDYQYLENEKFPWDPPYIPEMLTWQMYANRRSNAWWLNVWLPRVHTGPSTIWWIAKRDWMGC